MEKVELLAPAGDFDSLKAALANKADAVYFGAKAFNARLKANNFGEDLKNVVTYVHLHGAKAYLTLNTIIENNDCKNLLQTVQNALNAGIDAFIVQDFGVCNLIKNTFPIAEIHTSTQMAVNNYLGAIQAEKLGATRVVLSRETSIKDIKLIKEKTNLQIEYFIQGALCVCFSGNCYLSSHLFGKSGNKGECMQPCRLPYKAVLKGKEISKGYLFSAKDINMSKRLKDLYEAGVDSFKIEGRLRRPAYVASVVQTYRNIIDNNFITTSNDQTTLKKAFNRGDFCEGYLNGNGAIIDKNIQGHKGVKIGVVCDFKQGKKFNIIKIKSQHKITKGDGLKFIVNNLEQTSISAQDVKYINDVYEITTTSKVNVGAHVHLILDSVIENKELNQSILPISINLIALINQPLKLEAEYNNVKFEVLGNVCMPAQNQPLDEFSAKQSMQKLTDTPFFLKSFNLITNGVFVRKQELNELRRNLIQKIYYYFEFKNNFEVNYNYLNNELNTSTYNKKIYTIEISEKYNCNADYFVVKPSNYNSFNYKKIEHKNAFLYIPSFLNSEDIKLINNILENNKNLGVYAENIGALEFNKKTILGAKLNIKNIFAIKQLLKQNIVAVHTSPELSDQNFEYINQHFNIPIIKSDFQNFDLMTFVHCPIKTIYNNDCSNCKYCDGLEYIMQNGKTFVLKRYILNHCYFTLVKK
ncbi:MAG: U32 family peptidase [Clostridiales bacterium]|nr:U32 family peptidase [Clostridiales bacterium]